MVMERVLRSDQEAARTPYQCLLLGDRHYLEQRRLLFGLSFQPCRVEDLERSTKVEYLNVIEDEDANRARLIRPVLPSGLHEGPIVPQLPHVGLVRMSE